MLAMDSFRKSHFYLRSSTNHQFLWTLARRTFCSSSSKTSYYEDLGVDSDATAEEIKQAFYSQSKLYHPDRNPNDAESLKKFQSIQEAYDTLGNPRLRRKYDTGTLGRLSSVADREISKHKFEGDRFYAGRSKMRDEFGADRHRGKQTDLDQWTTSHRTQVFKRRRDDRRKEASVFHQESVNKQHHVNMSQQTSGRARIWIFMIIFMIALFKIKGMS